MDPLKGHPAGYPKLAGRMGIMPTAAMFRRFGALNARNLLYFQSELMSLEKKLFKAEAEDSESDKGMKSKYAKSFFWLNTSTNVKDGELRDGDTTQRDLVMKMRELLRDYNHAIIQQATILKLKGPDPFDLHHIQNFLSCKTLGNHQLIGNDRSVWGSFEDRKSHSDELICLKSRGDTDSFSRWLGSKAVKWMKACGCLRFKGIDRKFGTASLGDASIFKVTFWVTSIIAASLPVVSIVVLIKVKELEARLSAIAAFNVLLSVCLTVFTDAKRTDVFVVTAA
ncbi:hypothetical protein CC80DRAFT_482584 [Byssothecium circinans]|uniref:DUF6594 domain-containing protein n=1 Tax=Byssothecium circinans TaxID=147558 RepID=A0A6A5TNI2_9PLEO|nr:hypothetical protein CC80DRAFT_482584 [Byssothecium circinans]